MSGEKSTTIRYDPKGELILSIRSTKENLLRNIRFLSQQMKELIHRIEKEKLSIKDRNLKNFLNDYIEPLNARTGDLKEKENAVDAFPVRTEAKIKELERDQKALVKEYNYNKMISDELQSISLKISEIIEIDNIILKIEADIDEAESLMKNNGSLLQEWTPKGYEELVKGGEVFKKRFDKYMGDIGTSKTDSPNLSSIKEVYKTIRNHINKIVALVTDYTVKDHEVKTLKNKIGKLEQDISEQVISTKDIVIKNILSAYLSKLKMGEAEIEMKKYEGIDKTLDSISGNLPLLRKADEINSKIENEIDRIDSIFKENDTILRKWVIKDYECYLKDKEDITSKLAIYKKELQKGEVIDSTELNNILKLAKKLSDKIVSSLSVANENDKLHQKRLYVIKSLREVCSALGFKEINKPHYEKEGDSYSTMIQDFDTRIYGTLAFRVALEGKLESSSGISVDECGDKFSEISGLLREHYGVETSFKQVGEEEPLKKTKTAKDLPKSSATIYKSKGGS